MFRFVPCLVLALTSTFAMAADPFAAKLPFSQAVVFTSHYDKFKTEKLTDIVSDMAEEGLVVIPIMVKADPKKGAGLTQAQMKALRTNNVTDEVVKFYADGKYMPNPNGGSARALLGRTIAIGEERKVERPFFQEAHILFIDQYITKAEMLAVYSIILVQASQKDGGIAVLRGGVKADYIETLRVDQLQLITDLKLAEDEYSREWSKVKRTTYQALTRSAKTPSAGMNAAEKKYKDTAIAFIDKTVEFIEKGRGAQMDALQMAILMTEQKGLLEKKEDFETLGNMYLATGKDALEKMKQVDSLIATLIKGYPKDAVFTKKQAEVKKKFVDFSGSLQAQLLTLDGYMKRHGLVK